MKPWIPEYEFAALGFCVAAGVRYPESKVARLHAEPCRLPGWLNAILFKIGYTLGGFFRKEAR